MRIYAAGKEEQAEFDRFNAGCGCGNVFQSRDYVQSLSMTGMQTGLLIARDSKGRIIGGTYYYLPFREGIKSMFNKMFVTSGPVLRDVDDKPTLIALLGKITETAQALGAFLIEIRTPFIKHRNVLEEHGFGFVRHATNCSFVNELTSKDRMWKNLNKKTRNAIRKAEKAGVVVEDAKNDRDIDDMYRLHISRTRDIKGYIPLPPRFFHELHKNFSSGRKARFFIARHAGKPIAESIFLCFRGSMHYFSNASLREHQHLNANSLLVWRVIEFGIRNGFKRLDLYGSPCSDDRSHPQYGLYKFKSGFGGQFTREMQYYFKVISRKRNWLFDYAIRPVLLPIYKRLGR